MRHDPSVVGGVPSRSLLHRLAVFLATVGCLTLLGGSASGGPRTQQQLIEQAQKALTADEVKALQQKAEQGDAIAQCRLGLEFYIGQRPPQDYEQGVMWFRKAAEQGHAEAQFLLGGAYLLGRGVVQDYAQTMAWWRKAAEQGFAAAQFNLGMMYSIGRGVPQDYVEAQMWRNLAAALATGGEQKYYADGRDTLAKDMTPTQIAEAQKRASEWLAAFEKRKK
jgi:uncharacterized protein